MKDIKIIYQVRDNPVIILIEDQNIFFVTSVMYSLYN